MRKTKSEDTALEPVGLRGFFHYRLKDAETGEVVEEKTVPNIVTNFGKNLVLNRLGLTGTPAAPWLPVDLMMVGSSGMAVADSQTALVAQSGLTKQALSIYTSAGSAGMAAAVQWSASWSTQDCNYYISEVGLFNNSALASVTANASMFARALVVISKASNQTLEIDYTIQAQSA